MPALVNGTPTAPDANGTIQGTSGNDKISGTSGTDHIAGGKGVDSMLGGAGNDAFVIKLSDMSPSLGNQYQDQVYDFGGAGGWSATNNDFIALSGFGAGSTMTYDATRSTAAQTAHSDTTLQFYVIHSTNTGLDYTIYVHSLNSKQLSSAKGDFQFYDPATPQPA